MKRDFALTRIDHMIDIVQRHVLDGQRAATAIPFLSLLRSAHPTPITKGVLKPSCCVILQGHKRVHLSDEVLDYGPGEYLAVSVDMPASGHIVNATPDKPYLLLNLELDPQELAAIVLEAQIAIDSQQPVRGAFIGKTDDTLLDSLYQLVRLLDAPAAEAAFLAVGLKREILYRLLNGADGRKLYQNIVLDQQDRGISKAIAWLKERFDQTVRVEDLAQAINMSVSSLHHRFKAVTTMGPMQYQKQLRLQAARALLIGGEVDATTAAYKVGYESASQFSREYRRLFGAPPMQDIKKLRTTP
ncbi:helix-turn-helix domain-containing protein [Duganella sp. FT80W]|uniref:Helix-turn-helix domain-containing protein n=1 Tax=Duganella guangzhouensis TaxID=2666084 RepID=A0A6I2KXW7_9BURK|nr:AraC family transcriptional regulator [Duganella guangzhouensis]MRW90402.1 helix-turn-helix domain-containing protein [Duganella guangzhouensis]